MMTDLAEDAVSLTSSCEIVDALEDAVNDVSEVVTDNIVLEENKEASPPVELSWMNESSMSASQYAQVVFNDVKDSYPMDLDLEISYTLTSFIQPGHGDRVCLYKLPYLQPHEYVAYVWTKMSEDKTMMVKFSVSTLPKEEDFYQFQYLKGDNQVAGASVPFQLRLPGRSHLEVCGVTEQDDMMVIQTPQTSLQDKYSSLLDELTKKNESFIVLEQKNQTLLESSVKCKEMEEDLKILVRDKIQLEQTLTQTTETLNRSESLLKATTDKLENVETSLNEKIATIDELKTKIEAFEAKCESYNSDVELIKKERDSLASMLDQEIQARESLLKEKQELVSRLEDTSAMLNAAANSKDLAVAEIRSQIEQQDRLRLEMAKLREEAGHAEAELILVKQQLEKFTASEEDSYVVTSVLSSLGEKLEAKERELKQKDDELVLLKQLEASKNAIEIHESCLEDADSRAATLEKENKEIQKENQKLKEENLKLTKTNDELTERLAAGAAHYRKLAAEKQSLEKYKTSDARTVEDYAAKIDSLETKIVKLSEELRQARLSQDLQLSQIREAVGSSTNSSLGYDREDVSIGMVSDTSNLDSVRIDQAVRSSQMPVVKIPNQVIFRPGAGATALPHPLMPENVDPTTLIPELTPRTPAPYASSSSSSSSPTSPSSTANAPPAEATIIDETAFLNCPLCEEKFPAQLVDKLQQHVNKHIDENYKNCPMCDQKFDKNVPQRVYEEHVQEHFAEQQSIRGWDLGID